MDAWLNSVLARIANGTLLPAAYYNRLDCDAALAVRDSEEAFDAAWTRQFEQVENLWATADVPAAARSLAEDIRRESFLAVSSATGQHEIASYVSDDFDMIVRGRLVGAQDGFIKDLWDVYERGEFPVPPR